MTTGASLALLLPGWLCASAMPNGHELAFLGVVKQGLCFKRVYFFVTPRFFLFDFLGLDPHTYYTYFTYIASNVL
jgi:hypothetical protein